MCGRYLLDMDNANIQAWLHDDLESFKTNEVYPTNNALVLMYQDTVKANVIPWGFKKWDNKGHVINARSESITTSRFFKEDYKHRKAIVLASAFYEWDAGKNKHIITPEDGSIFYIAALIQENNQGFALLTQPAISPVSSIHTRQPIMIKKESIQEYLTHKLPASLVDYYRVDMHVESIINQASLF